MSHTAEDEVKAASEALARAELERDSEALRRLIHEEFAGVDENGMTIYRDDVVESFGAGMFVLQTLVVEEQHVRVTGDTGVVTAYSVMRGRSPKGEFHNRFRFTDVYVRQGGRWLLFASHVTPERRPAGFHSLPSGPPPPDDDGYE